jgi:hypothetical protein
MKIAAKVILSLSVYFVVNVIAISLGVENSTRNLILVNVPLSLVLAAVLG